MVALENHETYGTWCLALEPITKYAILSNQTINVNNHCFFFTVLNLILKSKFNTKDRSIKKRTLRGKCEIHVTSRDTHVISEMENNRITAWTNPINWINFCHKDSVTRIFWTHTNLQKILL